MRAPSSSPSPPFSTRTSLAEPRWTGLEGSHFRILLLSGHARSQPSGNGTGTTTVFNAAQRGGTFKTGCGRYPGCFPQSGSDSPIWRQRFSLPGYGRSSLRGWDHLQDLSSHGCRSHAGLQHSFVQPGESVRSASHQRQQLLVQSGALRLRGSVHLPRSTIPSASTTACGFTALSRPTRSGIRCLSRALRCPVSDRFPRATSSSTRRPGRTRSMAPR